MLGAVQIEIDPLDPPLVSPHRHWTVDELELLPNGPDRYEIIDGSLVVTPPPVVRHGLVASELLRLLMSAEPRNVRTLPGGLGVMTRRDRVFIPDLLVVHRSALEEEDRKLFEGEHVVLVAEIVSPTNAAHDLILKRALYAEAGIPHYWIIDSRGPVTATLLHLDGDTYVEQATGGPEDEIEVDQPFPVAFRPGNLTAP